MLSDTHCNREANTDQFATVRAVNSVAATGIWPDTINGKATGFTGGSVGDPEGVILTGDITGSGSTTFWCDELSTFRRFYEQCGSGTSVDFPVYIGIGNHDMDGSGLLYGGCRGRMWEYVEERHSGPDAPVPVLDFDAESRCYSWNWEGVHLVQTHKCATDTTQDQSSAQEWLSRDLAVNAADGRPVVIFQHYGFDPFGQEDRWWTANEREDFLEVLSGYNVIAIFAGHSHYAMTYAWNGYQVCQANNIGAEIGVGNDDGNGSFFVVRITNDRFEMMTCRWLDDSGGFECIAPFASRDLTTSDDVIHE